jgi:hypothetical protein
LFLRLDHDGLHHIDPLIDRVYLGLETIYLVPPVDRGYLGLEVFDPFAKIRDP